MLKKIGKILSLLVLVSWLSGPPPAVSLTNHGEYFPHGWLKPNLYGSKKIGDMMIDFDPAVEGEETRREEFILAEDAGRVLRLSHNGRVFCYVVDLDLFDPWDYQIVDYDGSGGFEMKEVPFSDFPLPRWTFINEPFLSHRTVDFTDRRPGVEQLISALSQSKKPCKKKYTPEQRAALAIARGGTPPPDECEPEPAPKHADGPRVALNILFEFDKDVLTSEAISTLKILGKAMTSKELSGSTFRLEGHTDAVGTYEYNIDLSRRRALAVQKYLMDEFKIPGSQLIPAGMGETSPLPNIAPEDGRNRRVEIINLSAGRSLMTQQAP